MLYVAVENIVVTFGRRYTMIYFCAIHYVVVAVLLLLTTYTSISPVVVRGSAPSQSPVAASSDMKGSALHTTRSLEGGRPPRAMRNSPRRIWLASLARSEPGAPNLNPCCAYTVNITSTLGVGRSVSFSRIQLHKTPSQKNFKGVGGVAAL